MCFIQKNKRNNKLLCKSHELPQKNSKKNTTDDVEDENDINNSSSKQRLGFKLVNNHIASYVMSMISVETTNQIELEKLCLLK